MKSIETPVRITTERDISQEMAEHYESGMTLQEIGEAYGLTRQGGRHRFIKAGIVRRRPKQIDKKRLETLYSEKRLPVSEIAGLLSVDAVKIRQALKSYEIPRRPPLKVGGVKVDFLRSLEIGVTGAIKWGSDEKYAHLHQAAKQIGIKISTRSLGNGEYAVTKLK